MPLSLLTKVSLSTNLVIFCQLRRHSVKKRMRQISASTKNKSCLQSHRERGGIEKMPKQDMALAETSLLTDLNCDHQFASRRVFRFGSKISSLQFKNIEKTDEVFETVAGQ